MNREPTKFFDEQEAEFTKTLRMEFRDHWGATPSEALKLCAMALYSMCDRGHAPVEFSPLVCQHADRDLIKRLNIAPIEGTDYHDHYLGVQGIGFVHIAYREARKLEQKAELDAAQLREANQLLAELNDMLVEGTRKGETMRRSAALEKYLHRHNISPAGV